ncbi:MAG TPA: TolC family protein, partial [Spirochaetia bacterium]|nr:TolC family protein [Spirochaetia bacterium]
ASSLDVLQSQIAERSAELDLATAQNTVAQDRQKLSVLVGWPIDSGYTVATVTVPTTPTITLDYAVATALANRVELKQILLNRESDAVSLKSASIQNLPVVSVNGGASYRLYWSGTGSSGTWNAGVSVSLPILDGGLAAAQVSQAQSALDQLSVQEAQQKQNITIGVRGAYFSVTDAGNRLALAQQNVDQAQKQYELEKIKFTAGLASNLDVLTAFVTLTNAQVAEEAANTTLSLAVLNLQQAMGTIDYSPSP